MTSAHHHHHYLDAARVGVALGFADSLRPFLDALASLDPPPGSELVPPDPQHAADLLARIGLPELDVAEVVASIPTPERAPAWWWVVERSARRLMGLIGDPTVRIWDWPRFEGSAQEVSIERRCWMVHVGLLTIPATQAWHRSRAMSAQVSMDSLADLRRHMAIHRRAYGATGLEAAWWFPLVLQGVLIDLGRLQYERTTSLPGFAEGEFALSVHIPEDGPLDPAAVEASIEEATAFFPRHFGDEYPPGATLRFGCSSWLLDRQLGEILGERSNIVSFQRRFDELPGGRQADRDVVWYVFRRRRYELDELPRRTRLERAIVEHLVSGGHFYERVGAFERPTDK